MFALCLSIGFSAGSMPDEAGLSVAIVTAPSGTATVRREILATFKNQDIHAGMTFKQVRKVMGSSLSMPAHWRKTGGMASSRVGSSWWRFDFADDGRLERILIMREER